MKLNFDNIPKTKVDNMRGGEGSVYLQKVFPTLAHTKMYALITIPPKASIGVHTHVEDEEVVTCIKGSGKLIIDGEVKPFMPMDISLVKSGRNHSIVNDSSEDLIVLAVVNEI